MFNINIYNTRQFQSGLRRGVIHKKNKLVEKLFEKFVEIYNTRKMEIFE